MQKSVIDFILSNDCSIFEKMKFTEEYKRISAEELKIYENLKESLSDEQKKEFDKFSDLIIDEEAMVEETYFKAGFKLGVRLAVECLSD